MLHGHKDIDIVAVGLRSGHIIIFDTITGTQMV